MKFADRFNRGNIIFDIDIKDFSFMNGYDFMKASKGNVIKIDGLYINKKGRFGDHPVAIIKNSKALLDLPSHMTDTAVEILHDSEAIEAIKNGAVGLKAHEYTDPKFHKQCVGYEWCDL